MLSGLHCAIPTVHAVLKGEATWAFGKTGVAYPFCPDQKALKSKSPCYPKSLLNSYSGVVTLRNRYLSGFDPQPIEFGLDLGHWWTVAARNSENPSLKRIVSRTTSLCWCWKPSKPQCTTFSLLSLQNAFHSEESAPLRVKELREKGLLLVMFDLFYQRSSIFNPFTNYHFSWGIQSSISPPKR